jgi:hypothetical protein
MNAAKLLRLCLRVFVVLLELYISPTEELVSAIVMLINVLCIEQMVSARFDHSGEGFDTHAVAMAVLLARPLGLARSTWNPSQDARISELAMEGTWCLICTVIAALGKEPRESAEGRWLPTILNAECALGVMLTYAPFDPMWMFASRVLSFTCLSVLLHMEQPFGRNCYLGERGYLACFCPVLLVDRWMACCFTLLCVVCIHWDDLRTLAGRGIRQQDPQPPSLALDSII